MRGKTARDLNEAEIRDLAIRYLGRREYAIEELCQKLVQRGADDLLTQQVVGGLADQGLVSDQRFAEMYVRTRMRRQFGPLKIRAELRARGVSDALITAELPPDESAWFDIATQWAGKKCRGELDYAGRAKIYRSLLNRGFSHEQANVALDTISESQS